MNDRFKFRIALHQDKYEEYGLEKFKNQRIFEVKTLNVGYENSTVEIIADYSNGDWAVREIDEPDAILMQCTGLKDKNGNLIYEGDIVNQIYEDGAKYKCEVVYNNCSFQLKHLEDSMKKNTPMYCYSINYLGHYTEKKLEVIGNRHENKELLESEE